MSLALLLMLGCGSPALEQQPPPVPVPAPPQAPAVVVPSLRVSAPDRRGTTPRPTAVEVAETMETLRAMVHAEARSPHNPWAVGHALLSLGHPLELKGGADAVQYLFAAYAERVEVAGEELIHFPAKQGAISVEPHPDLMLKAMVEAGVDPALAVTVGGQPAQVSDLYKHSLLQYWVDGNTGSFESFNDLPWALQGLTSWGEPGMEWVAVGGHTMTLDKLTHAAVERLTLETLLLAEAKKQGIQLSKRKVAGKGLFSYTCGGHHMVQGTASAVASGFGMPGDREAMAEQARLMLWRLDMELLAVDEIMLQFPEDAALATVLLVQRMKFLGHFVETMHKFQALNLITLTDDEHATVERGVAALVQTVDALRSLGIFDKMKTVKRDPAIGKYRANGGSKQVYLDIIGDGAHALRGLQLATGQATIAY